MCDLVGSNALQTGRSYRGLDDVVVGQVEIERASGLEIGLLPKSHYDEASGRRGFGGVSGHNGSVRRQRSELLSFGFGFESRSRNVNSNVYSRVRIFRNQHI